MGDSPDYKRKPNNSKYNENEMLKDYINKNTNYTSPALNQIEKNLTAYFSSTDYPYNEVRSFLENNSDALHLNTRDSRESSVKQVMIKSSLIIAS